MTDYQAQGLNQYLQPVTSPSTPINGVSSVDFDILNDRNIIGATKLRDFSFNSGVGGTITLGGVNDGNGELVIKDASGNTIVTGNSTGFHGYNTGGTETIRISGTGVETYSIDGYSISFYNVPGGTLSGGIGFQTGLGMTVQSGSDDMYILADSGDINISADTSGASSVNIVAGDAVTISTDIGNIGLTAANNLTIDADHMVITATTDDIILNADDDIRLDASDDIFVTTGTGDFYINGAPKTAVVKTSKGYNALYCVESPEVWFFDFCKGREVRNRWKFWTKRWVLEADPLFMETVEAPFVVMKTENKGYVQLWGKRKGMGHIRMESKTKKEFTKNNKFWSQKSVS